MISHHYGGEIESDRVSSFLFIVFSLGSALTIPDDREAGWKLFKLVLKADAERRRAEREDLIARICSVPVPNDVLNKLIWLGSHDGDEVLSHHPGHATDRKINSLFSMLTVFNRAHKDLNAQLDAFHAFSSDHNFSNRPQDHELQQIVVAVRKELMAFSFAAAALVALSRRLRKSIDIVDFDARCSASFDDLEHGFITELRNVFGHQTFPDVGWQIQYARDQDRKTDFALATQELLNYEEINASAREFAEQAGVNILVRPLVASYASKVTQFYAWLKETVETNLPQAVFDYRRCVKARRVNGIRMWYRILLPQLLAKNVDPYEHLEHYLLPEELEHARELPHRSREQVDFIISAVDCDGACNDELRELIYKLFKAHE